MSEWQRLTPYGVPLDGATAIGAGGTPEGYRSGLDARRSGVGRTPEAEWPDGYLGNVNSRREDRLLTDVKSRLTERNYQRGVHKGEKMGADSYYWPAEFNPQSALVAQANGVKWTSIGSLPVEQINHMGKNHLLAPEELRRTAVQYGIQPVTPVDPIRQSQFKRIMPTWR